MPVISKRNCAEAGAATAAAKRADEAAARPGCRGQDGVKVSLHSVVFEGMNRSNLDESCGDDSPDQVSRGATCALNGANCRQRGKALTARHDNHGVPAPNPPQPPTPPTPSLRQRFVRLAPYFKSGQRALAVAVAGSLVAALTEPVLPALMKPLLDEGFGQADIPLWLVPVVIVGLFVLRSAASFVAQYALAWAANQGVLNLRQAMFDHMLKRPPGAVHAAHGQPI